MARRPASSASDVQAVTDIALRQALASATADRRPEVPVAHPGVAARSISGVVAAVQGPRCPPANSSERRSAYPAGRRLPVSPSDRAARPSPRFPPDPPARIPWPTRLSWGQRLGHDHCRPRPRRRSRSPRSPRRRPSTSSKTMSPPHAVPVSRSALQRGAGTAAGIRSLLLRFELSINQLTASNPP